MNTHKRKLHAQQTDKYTHTYIHTNTYTNNEPTHMHMKMHFISGLNVPKKQCGRKRAEWIMITINWFRHYFIFFGVIAEFWMSHFSDQTKGGNLQILPKNTFKFSLKTIFIFSSLSSRYSWYVLYFFCLVHGIGTSTSELTTITGKSYVLLSSVQEFIETEAWVFLTFFLCLHIETLSIPLSHIKK